jgi:hypothetical protein
MGQGGTVGPEKSNYSRRRSKKVLLCRHKMKRNKEPFCKHGRRGKLIGNQAVRRGPRTGERKKAVSSADFVASYVWMII